MKNIIQFINALVDFFSEEMPSFVKKLVLTLILALASVAAWGQTHNPQDLLNNIRALNTGTNGWGITNLLSLVTNIGSIYNPTNVTYTNGSGTFIGSSTTYLGYVGTTNASTTVKLFNDINLHPDRNGQPIVTPILEYNIGLPTNLTYLGNATLQIEYVNPFGSNAPFGMTFRALYDGSTPSSSAADEWGFRVAGLATGKGTVSTNIPTWKWPGARALRLVAITNQYILAGPSAQTNSTFITKARVVSFQP